MSNITHTPSSHAERLGHGENVDDLIVVEPDRPTVTLFGDLGPKIGHDVVDNNGHINTSVAVTIINVPVALIMTKRCIHRSDPFASIGPTRTGGELIRPQRAKLVATLGNATSAVSQ